MVLGPSMVDHGGYRLPNPTMCLVYQVSHATHHPFRAPANIKPRFLLCRSNYMEVQRITSAALLRRELAGCDFLVR